MSGDKSGSPICGIYIRIDDYSDMQGLIGKIRQLAMAINSASGYEKNMDAVEFVCDKDNTESIERITDLIGVVQEQGLVTLVSGNVDAANIYGADGIILDDVAQIDDVRAAFKDDEIVGIVCGKDKNMAAQAIEKDVDCVILDPYPALVSWWNGQTETLSVVRGKAMTLEHCAPLVAAGAGFIDFSNYILHYEKGVMQATVNVMHAIETAAQTPKVLN